MINNYLGVSFYTEIKGAAIMESKQSKINNWESMMGDTLTENNKNYFILGALYSGAYNVKEIYDGDIHLAAKDLLNRLEAERQRVKK